MKLKPIHANETRRLQKAAGLVILLTMAFRAAGAFGASAPPSPASSKPAPAAGEDEQTYVVRSSTKIDFSEALIDGKMKAPEGMYLRGRGTQKMQNLLKLRQDFKKELEGSAEAAQTEYK